MRKFKKIRAGYYQANLHGGYHAVVEKGKAGWTYRFIAKSGAIALKGGDFSSKKEAEDQAYFEMGQIKVPVQNLMSGQMVLEAIDTPWCCSVASESYWSA